MRSQHLFVAAMAALLATTSAQASVEISADPTKNMNCAGGVCSPTAKKAVLNTTDLANMLATSDVKVVTGSGAVTITVSASFSWTSTHRLTLDAYYNVSFRAPVAVTGQGAVTIVTSDGGPGGDLLFFPGGKLDFWDTGATFGFNGTSYVLVNDIASIAAAYATNRYAVLALAKDYDAGPDGTYHNSAVPATMDGTFEGLGHTISNFSASGEVRETGFFAQSLSEFSAIRDLTLSNVDIAGGADSLTGALGGGINAAITNTHSSGHVSAGDNSSVGGLVGYGGRFFHSDSSVAVTCTKLCDAGGLVGFGGHCTLSHASGTVTVGGRSTAGGLVGVLGKSSISQSYATGDVVSEKLQRSSTLGGLAGLAIQDSSISDSYALGAIRNQGASTLGGLIGFGQANIVKTSYAAGLVGAGAAPSRAHDTSIGGFIGFADYVDEYTNDYWDMDSSGMTVGCAASKPRNGCPDIQGLTDTQMKSGLPAGFNPGIWAQNSGINNGYPYLLANPPQ